MNRNVNSHFAQVPTIGHPRSRMNRSHGFKFTGNVGELIPIYVDPNILPGDTVTMDTSKIIRFQTMLTPVMDSLIADFYWFFIPHRLVWDHWINMMGENTSSAWLPAVEYNVPKLVVYEKGATVASTHTSSNKVGSLLDYMGYPVEMSQSGYTDSKVKINALPFRAYAKVVNDWFISENLTDPVNLYTGDNDQDAYDDGGSTGYIEGCARGGAPFTACKTFDLYTSALPQPQKGPTVTLPLGTRAPVVTAENHIGGTGKLNFTASGMSTGTNYNLALHASSTTNLEAVGFGGPSPTGTSFSPIPNNLWADLSVATAASINSIRFAFQLQKFYERTARGGSRYIEMIRSFFGVQSPDARMQRSEYLGGNRVPIIIDQVTNTAQTASDALGDVGAYSRTSDVHSDFTKSFSEHGTLMCVMVCRRAGATYSQGLQPWMKDDNRLSYYWPTFDSIGEQPLDKDLLYLGASGTFGYNEAWAASYRYAPNRLSGEMRPYISNSLGSWHFGDDYNAAPSLSDSWIREDKANIDRTLTVTSAVSNQFWCDLWFKTWYTRPMSMYSVPGLVDHF